MKLSTLSLSLFIIASAAAFAADTAPTTPFPSGPGVNALSITFDQEPKEEGLSFDRSEPHATKVDVQGQSAEAWTSEKGVTPSMMWARSFRFHVTDPRFQKGGRPVGTLEITFYMPKPGSLLVSMDTATGNKRIYDQWYHGPGWETVSVPFDNAYFGARPDNAGDKIPMEGYDFRIDAPGNQLYLRSVRLAGYDTEHDVLWSKMLKSDGISTHGPGDILVWQKGPGQKLGLTLHNLASVPANFHYRLQISDRTDKARFVTDAKFSLKPSEGHPFSWTVDTSDWPLGPYTATFTVFDDAQPGDILYEKDFRLGIVTSTALEKAREGEFLYGLDVANSGIYPVHTPTAMAYFRLMGVDIVRNVYEQGMQPTVENIGIALDQLKAGDVQATLMAYPAHDPDPVKMAAQQQATEALVEEAERIYGGRGPGKLRYYELGNEPDLTNFYPGPTSDYVRDFYGLRDAIKRGDDKAGRPESESVVTTGGLSFAGKIGPARSEEIIQGLDPQKIDAIAYHGHGPGINAERSAYERVHAVTVKYNKADHPFIETESGFSGQGPRGLQLQARTAIEKFVYAESKNEPLLMFFRLFMEGSRAENEGGYGMTDNFVEPQPSVMSYRNLVERLRHQAYVSTLDLSKAGVTGADAYVFAEKDAKRTPTGKKTIVAFTESPAHTDVRLKLDAPGAAVKDVMVYDMYGNASPIKVADGNIVDLPLADDPVYLSWSSPGDAAQVDLVPPMLALENVQPLLVDAETPVKMLIRNSGTKPMDAQVSLSPQTRLSAEASPESVKISVPSGGSAEAAFKVRLHSPTQPLALPNWWKVFTDVDLNKAGIPALQSIPASLPGTNGEVKGTYVWAPDRKLNLGKIAGGFSDRRPGVVFCYIDSDSDTKLPAAANADWFMAWFVNGQKVYDTLDIGDRAGSLADHTFDLPLKKGRNLIAAEVLSGSGGWALEFGGPKERGTAVSGGNDPDHLAITVESGGETSKLAVPVTLQDTVPVLQPTGSLDSLTTWLPETPLTVLDEATVKNLWMKEPDSSKWYSGEKDLAGSVWVDEVAGKLQVFAAITDDKHVEAASTDALAQGDALRVVLADDAGKALLDVTGGLVGGKAVLNHPAPGVSFTASEQTDAQGNPCTLYRLEIPKTLTGGAPFHLNVSALDNDSSFLKQTLDFGNIDNPVQGVRLKMKD